MRNHSNRSKNLNRLIAILSFSFLITTFTFTGVTLAIPPSIPTALTIGNITGTTISFSWTAPATSGSGLANPAYYVERAPDSSGIPGTWTQIGTTNSTSYTDTGLSVNTKYFYRVRAKDTGGNYSDYSGTTVQLDNMEYASTSQAQAAYVTNTPVTSASGGSITDIGNYRLHTFTSNGTFAIYSGISNVQALIVGGGGGASLGGGGGGGVITLPSLSVSTGSYAITVGTGGTGTTTTNGTYYYGGNSTFAGYTATGGGAGGKTTVGGAGGSGGGAGAGNSTKYAGGAGTSGQGSAGGANNDGVSNPSSPYPAGGGGGAGAVGGYGYKSGSYAYSGNGGNGYPSSITGTQVYYAAGGGGGSWNCGSVYAIGGSGGAGGGGSASLTSGVPGENASGYGSGGGGGCSNSNAGGNGSQGVVYVKYLISPILVSMDNTSMTQGSYDLKAVAVASSSLNQYIYKTLSSPANLSNLTEVKFDLKASRTGSNIKIGLHDSGGTTTEITPNITVANSMQKVTMDLSSVANSNKDAIDKITITVVNASADNTFYIDNMFGISYVSATTTNGTPTITSITPSSSTLSGTSTVISGSEFTGTNSVTFGGVAASSYTVVNDSQITATAPAHAAGAVDIAVTNAYGTTTSYGGFTYIAPPSITAISPIGGHPDGNTSVTISGSNFTSGGSAALTIGGLTPTNIIRSATSITAVTPAHLQGPVDIVVTNADGQTSTLAGGYTYAMPPTITGLSISNGSQAGGNSITITGTGFKTAGTGSASTLKMSDSATAPYTPSVNFSNYTVVDSTTITATTPAHTAGTTYLIVTNPDTQAAVSSAFTYDPAPSISSVDVNYISASGGTVVNVSGSHFVFGASVKVNGVSGSVNSVNANSINFTAPSGTFGSVVSLQVINPDGQSDTLSNSFTYVAQPSITSVSPNGGNINGGSSVTISGSNFLSTATVTIGGIAATGITVNGSGTSITATTPAHSAGSVNVVVTNPDSQFGTMFNGYTYATVPTITSISVNHGSQAGGTTMTISGTGFVVPTYGVPGTPGTVLSMGTSSTSPYGTLTAFSTYTVVNSTTITATTPAHDAGIAYLVATNPGILRGVSSAYTYDPAPTVGSANPNVGSSGGGNLVTISGANFLSGATVKVGTARATVLSVNSSTITIKTPAGPVGNVDITVTNPDNQVGTLSAGFEYRVIPHITALSKTQGPVAGGTSIYVSANNIATGFTVTVGGQPVTTSRFYSGGFFYITMPAHAAGTVDVVVTNPDGLNDTASYTYNEAPVGGSLSPDTGSTLGGTNVTISGANFLPGATACILAAFQNPRCLTALTVVDANTMTGQMPAKAAGTYRLQITNPDGQISIIDPAFTFVAPPPSVISMYRVAGSTNGGSSNQIVGANFGNGMTVSIGGVTCDGIVCKAVQQSGYLINVTMPAMENDGPVDIVVTNGDGQSGTLHNGFTYIYPPSITSITPDSGITTGGAAVTISGSHFQTSGTTRVRIAGVYASNVVVVNDTTITAKTPATMPARSAGLFNVVVQNPDGQIATLANSFNYILPLTISGISQRYGPVSGGTVLTLNGISFVEGTTVSFAGVPAEVRSVEPDGKSMTVVTGAYSGSGLSDILVSNPDGQTALWWHGFNYLLPPTVSKVSPNTGTTAGGKGVWITGTNFLGAYVTIDGQRIEGHAALPPFNTTSMYFVTPPHSEGPVDIIFSNIDGQSITLPNAYTYSEAPSIDSITPDEAPLGGGTSITIKGNSFRPGLTLKLADPNGHASYDEYPTNIVVVDDTTITATTTPAVGGFRNLVVTNPDGQNDTLLNGFNYSGAPIVTAKTPTSGSTAGGTTMTFTGFNFVAGSTVTFGSVQSPNVSVTSSTSMTATSPAHSAGTVDIMITKPDNQYKNLTQVFTYFDPPQVTSVSPAYATVEGGQVVSIIGHHFRDGDTVSIGNIPATVGSITENSISVTVPAGVSQGAAAVKVTSPETSINEFSNLPNAIIIYPSGPIAVIANPGNESSTFSINPGGSQLITFNKPLTAESKLAVENAITASDVVDTLTYTWNSLDTAVTVHNGSGNSLFHNNVYALSLSDIFGTTTENVLIIKSRTQEYQTEINSTLNLGSGITDTVINKKVTSSTISIPESVVEPVIDLKPVFINSVAPLQQMQIDVTNVAGDIHVSIPGDTTVTPTQPDWDGKMLIAKNIPDATAADQVVLPVSTASAVNIVGIQMGQDFNTLNFSKAVRIKLDGQAGKHAGYSANGEFHEIINACTDDTQAGNDMLAFNGECSIDVGSDLIIWTKHFTDFFAFNILYSPTVTSVSPTTANIAGGDQIIITGSNFGTGATVSFGGAFSDAVVVDSNTQITATAPIHIRGQVDVVVTNPDAKQGTLTNAITYADVPGLPRSLSATNGDSQVHLSWLAPTDNGGSIVTGYAIRYRLNPDGDWIDLPTVTGISTNITSLINGTAYDFEVAAVNAVGTGIYTDPITAQPDAIVLLPTITGASPVIANAAGGDSIIITGTNFIEGDTVKFGTVASTSITVDSDTQITAIAPAHARGLSDITVSDIDSHSATLTNAITFIDLPGTPLSPAATPGNTQVSLSWNAPADDGGSIITGYKVKYRVSPSGTWTTPTAVAGTSATITTLLNGTAYDFQIAAVNIMGTGNYTSTVTSTPSAPSLPAPTVSSIDPATGDIAGGTSVTITGSNFQTVGTTGVSFGGTAATSVSVTSSTTITATTPAHSVGAVNVTITNPDSQTATLASGFTYTTTGGGTGGGTSGTGEGNINIACNTSGSVTIEAPQSINFENKTVDFSNETDASAEHQVVDDIARIRITDNRGFDPGAGQCGNGFSLSVQSSGLHYTNVDGSIYNLPIGLGTVLDSMLSEDTVMISSSPDTLIGNVVHASTASAGAGTISGDPQLVSASEAIAGNVDFYLDNLILRIPHDGFQMTGPNPGDTPVAYSGYLPAAKFVGLITFTLTQ